MNELFRLVLQKPGMAEKYAKWKKEQPAERLRRLKLKIEKRKQAT